MASEEHQRLHEVLADRLAANHIEMTHLHVENTSHLFRKYGNPPTPPLWNGKRPDLRGKGNGVTYLGEAETSTSGSDIEGQLEAFSRPYMDSTPILHVIVPSGKKTAMETTIARIGLGSKLYNRIFVSEGQI